MLLRPFTLHTPKTLRDTLELYGSLKNAKLQAGGTFLLNSLKLLKKKRAKTPENIISLTHVNELRGISAKDSAVAIKSMTTIDEIYKSSLLADNLSVLRAVAKNISTQPIRNMATFGGNLTCRYTWTELPAAMIALEAQMHFSDIEGGKETVSAEEFFRNAAKTDKILTHVVLQRTPETLTAYYRAKKSPYVDVPLIAVCVKTKIIDNKFTETIAAINNGVSFAQRDHALENFFNGNLCRQEIIEEALRHVDSPIYDARGSDYKEHMFRVAIRSAILELIQKKK